jgi:hypothetical protein
MREFDGIREAQLFNIINQGWAAPHDEQGHRLTPKKFHALVCQETQNSVDRLKKELAASMHRELGWVYEESSHNRLMRNAYQERIEEAEEDTPGEVLYSMSFIRKELERVIQVHYTDIFQAYQESKHNAETAITPNILPLKGELSPIDRATWQKAIEEYESHHTQRKNDALPRRMRLFLRLMSGEPYTDLEQDTDNLNRDIKNAHKKDIPRLKEKFPSLPDIA